MADTLMLELFGLVALCTATAVVWNWPVVGWLLLGVAILTDTPTGSPPVTTVSGISLYWPDLICIILLAAGLANSRSIAKHGRGRSLLLWCLLALFAFSLLQGVARFGVTAINEFRGFAYIIALFFWALGLDWDGATPRSDPRRHFQWWLAGTGTALVVLTAINVSKTGFVSADAYAVLPNGDFVSLRPIVAGQALVLALAGMWFLGSYLTERRGRALALALLFLGTVLISQHRSVWVAALGGLAGMALFAYPRARRLALGLFSGAAFVGFLLIIWAWGTVLVTSLGASVGSVFAERSTFTDRVDTWQTLINQNLSSGLGVILFGKPMGSGWTRVGPIGVVETYMPHNWYVSFFLRVGIVGLLLLAALIVTLARRQLRAPRDAVGLALLATIAIYLYVYSLPWYVTPVVVALWLKPVTPKPPVEHPAPHLAARRAGRVS